MKDVRHCEGDSKIAIEDFGQAYVPEVAQLLRAWWVMHARRSPNYLNVGLFETMDYEQYVTIQTVLNPQSRAWVAIDEMRRVVGFARIELQHSDRYRAFLNYLLVDDIVVLVERGLDRALIRQALLDRIVVFAEAEGYHALFTRVYEFNKDDRAWFEEHEFEAVHTELFRRLKSGSPR